MPKYSESEMCEEHGYRRGFDQGMYIVIKMIKDGNSIEEISKIKDDVHRWRYNGKYGKDDIRIDPPVKF